MKHIDSFMESKISIYLCGCSLLKMIGNWKKQLDDGGKVAVIFMDLSKVFDTTNHSLLLAKLKTYGFFGLTLSLLQSYQCNSF